MDKTLAALINYFNYNYTSTRSRDRIRTLKVSKYEIKNVERAKLYKLYIDIKQRDELNRDEIKEEYNIIKYNIARQLHIYNDPTNMNRHEDLPAWYCDDPEAYARAEIRYDEATDHLYIFNIIIKPDISINKINTRTNEIELIK